MLHHIAVKEAVLPFARFPGVDTVLGPEMRSTGEVMGLDTTFGRAFAKSQIGAGLKLPLSGTVFISVKDADKDFALAPARALKEMGFELLATRGTAKFLQKRRPRSPRRQQGARRPPACRRCDQERRSAARLQHHGRLAGACRIRSSIRRTALQMKVPYYTTIAGAAAATEAIAALREGVARSGARCRVTSDCVKPKFS